MNWTRNNQVAFVKAVAGQVLGFVLTLVIGFAVAPWFFKGVILFFDKMVPWYFTYFSNVMGVK